MTTVISNLEAAIRALERGVDDEGRRITPPLIADGLRNMVQAFHDQAIWSRILADVGERSMGDIYALQDAIESAAYALSGQSELPLSSAPLPAQAIREPPVAIPEAAPEPEPVEAPPTPPVAPPAVEEAPATPTTAEVVSEPQVPAPPIEIELAQEPEPSAAWEEAEPLEASGAAEPRFVLDEEEEEAPAFGDGAAGRTPFDLEAAEPETEPAPTEEVSEPETFPYAGPISGLAEEEAAVEEPAPAPEPAVESADEIAPILGAAVEAPAEQPVGERLSVKDARKRARARLAEQGGGKRRVPLLLVIIVLLIIAALAAWWLLGMNPSPTAATGPGGFPGLSFACWGNTGCGSLVALVSG